MRAKPTKGTVVAERLLPTVTEEGINTLFWIDTSTKGVVVFLFVWIWMTPPTASAPFAPVGELITPDTNERRAGRSDAAVASIVALSMLVVPADGARSLIGNTPSTITGGSSTVWGNAMGRKILKRQMATKILGERKTCIPDLLPET